MEDSNTEPAIGTFADVRDAPVFPADRPRRRVEQPDIRILNSGRAYSRQRQFGQLVPQRSSHSSVFPCA
jgi:hypothetical protein